MYITIEGAEATGKSTQAKLLADALVKKGHRVFLTKEPGSPHDSVCQGIRSLLLSSDHHVDRRAALCLFMADRAQHIQHVKAALKDNVFVISDRSSISSFNYFIAEERAYIDEVCDLKICKMLDFVQQIAPDICFICQADFTVAADHLSERAHLDRIERKPRAFHENVHELFFAEQIDTLCGMLDYAPQKIFWAPATYANSIDTIANFLLHTIEGIV